jgi:PKD repeat protein
LDPSSFYDPTTGTIVMVASVSDLGLSAGDTIAGFNAASVQSVNTPAGGLAETVDGMPDSLGYQGSFSVESNGGCFPDNPPTAGLTATPRSGNVPLTVSFDGSSSSDPDTAEGDHVASYTFNFGDGSAPVTQSSPTVTHTYANAGEFQATLTVTDTHGKKSIGDASTVIDVKPTVTCFEDDSSNIAYAKGWHTVKDKSATAGHFRTSNGSGLSFTFQTSATSGTLTYNYATAKKAGTADLYLDGNKVQTVNYGGSSGTGNAPVFGSSATVPLSGSGTHTFSLQNTKGLNFVDQICVTDGSSNSQPTSAPGETTTSSDTVQSGEQDKLDPDQLFVPVNAKSISVLAESSTSVPFAVSVLDALGNVIHTARSSNGVASLDVPVNGAGLYTVELVNLGLGPVNIWSAATPYLSTG